MRGRSRSLAGCDQDLLPSIESKCLGFDLGLLFDTSGLSPDLNSSTVGRTC